MLAKIAILVLIILFIQKRRADCSPEGQGGGGMITGLVARSLDRGAIVFLVILAAIGILVPCST